MRNTNKKGIVIGSIGLVILIILGYIYLTKQLSIAEAKVVILQQQVDTPSNIEIQKQELVELEGEWRSKQAHIDNMRSTILELQAKIKEEEINKLDIEPKIRDKRSEILGK